jgi:HlyD family secretion protein
MNITRSFIVSLMLTSLSACEQDSTGWYGVIERDRHTLSAPVGELISTIHVQEGDQVAAGQLIIQLDGSTVNARISQRVAELEELRALREELINGPRTEAIARAESALQGAQADVLDAEQRLQRAVQLLGNGAGTQSELDQRLAARDQALARIEQARQQLAELKSGTRPEQLNQIDARIAAATVRLLQEEKALADLSLASAYDAVVDSLPWRMGDRVAPGAALASLLINENAFIRVYVPADTYDQVKVGGQLLVQADADMPAFLATIRHIRPQPAFTPFYALNERDRARLMYLTELTLPDSYADLPTGMNVEVMLP